MASFNKVILIGNLTRDPELRYTPSGQAVCDFSIAINRKYSVNGQEKDEVCFVDVVAWSKQAESCGKYLKKGACVFVDGRLRNDTWEDRDGKKRSKLRVTADRVQFMSSGTSSSAPSSRGNYEYSEGGNYNNNYAKGSNQNSHHRDYEPMPEPPEDIYNSEYESEDDIPF